MIGTSDHVRIRRQTSAPSMSGSPRSRITAAGLSRVDDLDRLVAGTDRDDAIAASAQRGREDPHDRRLVVDDEDEVVAS